MKAPTLPAGGEATKPVTPATPSGWFEIRYRTALQEGHAGHMVSTPEAFVCLKDGAPDWLADAVEEAHDGELPNDWRYGMCESICQILEEDGLDPDTWEIADRVAEVYTGRLLGWLNDLGRVAYVDQSLEEFPELPGGLPAHLMNAQAYAIDAMALVLQAAYQENAAE